MYAFPLFALELTAISCKYKLFLLFIFAWKTNTELTSCKMVAVTIENVIGVTEEKTNQKAITILKVDTNLNQIAT